ncbi:beta-N-acetylhexosaminidase [Chitinophaga agri]|uniref:beta-N-acetylhexosaminidase n=1 Tax=Chitinophaga agri TaxID=2703787 RepID=A0A6B9ZMI8_9BACT|nr:family 20 glycosylhydrolase [Chitinophaga agri]QHS63680.1 family 20 glycosylhydrolase [Chitinophaga agri]
MLKRIAAILAISLGVSGAHAQSNYSIIPKPASVQPASGRFELGRQTVLVAQTDAARKNADLFNEFLWNRYGIKLTISREISGRAIILEDQGDAAAPEAYNLAVTPERIMIRGGSAGCFYGLQSVLQLIEEQNGGLSVPAVTVADKPEFGYRGVMIDVARHFFSLDEMKKIVDLMAYFKFNRLHWHLTDDQGWRLEIKKYPKLTQVSAWRDSSILGQYGDFKPFVYDGVKHGGYYTQEEARDLVRYAADRKITILPEIELPGHSTAVLAAYPQFGCKDTTYHVPGYWGVHYAIYCPKEETFRFLEDVLTEVMAIFPGEYIHVGGDEVPKEHWKESSFAQNMIKKQQLKDEHELQSYFISRIEKFLNKNGRRLVGWDEILEGGLAPNATVMSWRGEKGGIAAARMGHDVIMTPNSHLYIDHYQSKNKEEEPTAIGGFLPLERVYSYHPRPDSLTAEQQQHVLGVQANLWTEYIGTNNKLEYMLFPRMLALSEVAWTARGQRNYDDFSTKRLPSRLQELEKLQVFYRIPEAKVTFGKNAAGMRTAEIMPFVANSSVYYTVDGHKADQTANLYNGAIVLPVKGKSEKAMELNYIIVTPGGRVSNMFTVSLEEK